MNFQEPSSHSTAGTTPTLRKITPAQTRRVVIITSLAVLLVLGVLFGFNAMRSAGMKAYFAGNKPPPQAVTTEIVKPGSIAQGMTAIGSVSAVHQVAIPAEVSGRVTKVLFEAGAEVKKGDVLVQINDAPERADLAASRAQQQLAKVSLERSRQLTVKGFSSQSNLDQAQSQYDAAAANIAKLEAVIAQKQIRAPFDGALGVRQVELGQYLTAGATIAMLTDIATLNIDFTVPEQARPQLKMGQDVSLTVDAYPDRKFVGKIYVIDPQIVPDSRNIKLQALVDNRDRVLMAGMFANVRVELPALTDVLTITETAIDHSIYGDSVYVVQEEKAADGKASLKVHRVNVEAGERVNGRVVVTGGVKAGDRIVTAGQTKLYEGSGVLLNEKPVLVAPEKVPVE